ncbi:MAG TPA: MarR family transcriptional regulator [Candidatus Dormibacteraeota bacterium]|nr:MarR family transcriptional regulator [Candidatus Dormibacteraeota bacterium]
MAGEPGGGLAAIRAWLRLQRSFDAFNLHLRDTYGVTGAQLAMLRIVAEQEPITLRMLRAQLEMHPATIGQLVDRIVARGLLTRTRGRSDSRERDLAISASGRRLLRRAPLAGPVRLRTMAADATRLERLAEAFRDAVILFGLEAWAT